MDGSVLVAPQLDEAGAWIALGVVVDRPPDAFVVDVLAGGEVADRLTELEVVVALAGRAEMARMFALIAFALAERP